MAGLSTIEGARTDRGRKRCPRSLGLRRRGLEHSFDPHEPLIPDTLADQLDKRSGDLECSNRIPAAPNRQSRTAFSRLNDVCAYRPEGTDLSLEPDLPVGVDRRETGGRLSSA